MKLTQSDYELIPLYEYGLLINFKIPFTSPAYIQQLKSEFESKLKFMVADFVPAYQSLTIHLHQHIFVTSILTEVNLIIQHFEYKDDNAKKVVIHIPVCFADEFALDKARVCNLLQKNWATITETLTQQTFTVFMLGFLPGFAYMGMLPEALKIPRLSTPRKKVESGSVAIADLQTGIYPTESPGGWNVIGQTPIGVFNINRNRPSLLQAGDEIRYVSITEDEFYEIKSKPNLWKLQKA
jgi:inhibitor of KinA